MSKLSTAAIVKLLPTWLVKLDEDVRGTYCLDEPGFAEAFGLPGDSSVEAIGDAVVREFVHGRWVRRNKRRLGPGTSADDFPDAMGETLNLALLDRLSANDGLDRCWIREFSPSNDIFANNFELTVVTDPTDHEVLFWSVNVD